MSQKLKKKIQAFDLARAFALLFLMAAHVHDYVDFKILKTIYPAFAHLCLILFAFTSGYFLPFGLPVENWTDLTGFLRKRLIRIYVLYVPALISFAVVFDYFREDTFLRFGKHLLSGQLFYTNHANPCFTLWYIGFVVPCYVVFAVNAYLLFQLEKRASWMRGISGSQTIGLSAFLLVLLAIENQFYIDSRFALYFPALIGGVCASEIGLFRNREISLKSVIVTVVLIGCLSIGIIAERNSLTPIPYVLKMIVVVAIPVTFVYLLSVIEGRLPSFVLRFMQTVSYSSFAIYLFHRPILSGVQSALLMFGFENPYFELAIFTLIVFPFILIPSGFLIQQLADELCKRLLSTGGHQAVNSATTKTGVTIQEKTK